MNVKIQSKKHAGRDLQRILLHQVRQACGSVKRLNREPEEALHQLRIEMKKIRSLLRLTRDSLGAWKSRRFTVRIQGIKNALEAQREGLALLKTLEKLEADSAIVERFLAQKETGTPCSEKEIENLLHEAEALRKEVRDLDIGDCTAAEFCAAFQGTLKKMSSAMRHCGKTPNGENTHIWRKRVKDVWYQNEVLGKHGEGKKFTTKASRLSDLLGDSHDLSILETRLKTADIEGTKPLFARIRQTQKELRKKAFRVGKKLL